MLAIAVATLGYVVFWGDPRFHVPLMPVFALLAGWAVAGFSPSSPSSAA